MRPSVVTRDEFVVLLGLAGSPADDKDNVDACYERFREMMEFVAKETCKRLSTAIRDEEEGPVIDQKEDRVDKIFSICWSGK